MQGAIDKLMESCRQAVPDGSHVLCIQDTSEFCYGPTKGRMGPDDPDLGPMSKDGTMGFFVHPALVVDAESVMPLGFSSVLLWNRSEDKGTKHSRRYKEQPLKRKESYKWQYSLERSCPVLAHAARRTSVADRESDIYSYMDWQLSNKWDFVVRTRCDRMTDSECRVGQLLGDMPVRGTYKLKVGGRNGRKAREAVMDVRYLKATLKEPGDSGGGQITVHCVLTEERASSVPKGEKPIRWMLYTSHTVDSLESALQIVWWYSIRWLIEELFRVLKSEGMRLEQVQLETGEALKKLTVVSLLAALNILQLKLAYDYEREDIRAETVFSEEQIRVLSVIEKKRQGKTQKQCNPFKSGTLAWASWIIAREGGWSGYVSQGRPGYITISRGHQRFCRLCEFYELLKTEYHDVYKE